ncbi:DUF6972 family protein [Moorena producens]|uniref:DUF6972 family protein n=1 Tax=Moorena producens TaxID=1155739 RepID=UPI003C72AA1C
MVLLHTINLVCSKHSIFLVYECYRISPDGSPSTPLFYGEVKIDGKNQYHVIPRTRPSQ